MFMVMEPLMSCSYLEPLYNAVPFLFHMRTLYLYICQLLLNLLSRNSLCSFLLLYNPRIVFLWELSGIHSFLFTELCFRIISIFIV